jgi:putative nucleotidyltransferase with HDIG domain
MGTAVDTGRVTAARILAEMLLEPLPDRWRHTVGVARRAAELGHTVSPADHDVLLVSAWLHDIGYSPLAHRTRFHPLDGAAYLLRHGWPARVAGLVAHHSGAIFVARAQGMAGALGRYPDERSAVSDALTYADQSTGPVGQPLPIRLRMAEMLVRHGPDSAQARVHHARGPHLLAVAERVERRLAATTAVHADSTGGSGRRHGAGSAAP